MAAVATVETGEADLSRAVQGSLFAARPVSNVIPFTAYSGARSEAKPRPTPAPARPAAAKPAVRKPAAGVNTTQATLDFLPPAPAGPRTLGTTVEAVIACEAPVATTLHRAIAAALDWSMVLIGYGLFLLTFRTMGGAFELNRTNSVIFAAMLPFVAFAYGALWTVAGTETPGMRWAQLQLITFDGLPLEPRHRMLRFAGSCLSLCTLIGLLWSLADEESLNWQDHISRTFPTPLASETRVFHRR